LLLLIIIKSEQKYTAYFTAQSDILVMAAELRTMVTPVVLTAVLLVTSNKKDLAPINHH